MTDTLRNRLKDNRLGLALAALFGWLLSFPLFGRLLQETAGEIAEFLGLAFMVSHAAGLLLLHLLPAPLAVGRTPIWVAGGTLTALTVVYAFMPRLLIIDVPALAVLGLISAYLVLAWAARFADRDRPLELLAVAMAGANLVFAAVSMPLALPVRPMLVLLALLALCGVILLQAEDGTDRPRETPLANRSNPRKTIKALAAFIIAVYFIGGVWYYFFALELAAAPHWQATVNSLIYAGGVVFLFLLARRGQPGNLATYSVSALGVGLLIALSDSGRTIVALSYRGALNLGLAAADLFLWHALWSLAKHFESRRVFGLGLGFSVLMIALSVISCSLGIPGRSQALYIITALTLLFLLVPLVFKNPFEHLNIAAGGETAAEHAVVLLPPDLLTPTESRIYTFLLQGATDADIAGKLHISKHTVKFHGRNILRKLEVRNRKELLSRHLKGIVMKP